MRPWNRRRDPLDLEGQLRGGRPEPRQEFLASLSDRVRAEGRRAPRTALRVAFAAGLTALALGAVSSVGGLGYAATGASHALGAVKKVTGSHTQSRGSDDPAEDQYGIKPGKGCGDKNHVHEREGECKMLMSDVTKTEGNSGTTSFVLTVSLDRLPRDTVTVAYATAGGSATPVVDFTPTSGTLTFPIGTQVKPVTVQVIGDRVKESDETFFVNLSHPNLSAIIVDGQGVGNIRNDD